MSKCAWNTCNNEAKPGKKYCTTCAKIARQKWIEMVSQSNKARQEKQEKFDKLWHNAVIEGNKAALSVVPTPMVVSEHVNPLDDSSKIKQQWFVPSGACGFAWVVIKPATCSFARWLAKQKIGHKSYYGGWEVSAGNVGNQSIEIKEAWCQAVCKHLQSNGIECYMNSRLD